MILGSLLLRGWFPDHPAPFLDHINFTPIEVVCGAALFKPVLILLLKDFNLEVPLHLILGHYCFSVRPIGLSLRSQHPSI